MTSTTTPRQRGITAAVSLLLAAILALASVVSATPAAASTIDTADRVFALLNMERAKVGLPALKRLKEIDDVAMRWSEKQAAAKDMSHNPSFSDQIPDGWRLAGENVAYTSSSVATGDKFNTMWMKSDGHRRNMLNPRYTHVGISAATTADGRLVYITENFGEYPAGTNPGVGGYRLDRVAGPDRYATSVAVSQASYYPGVPVVYLANGLSSVDALSAASVAGRDDSPVLLTPASKLLPATAAEIARLDPGRIVILGDVASVSAAIEQQVSQYAPVTRLAGRDRYATAAAISAASFAPGVKVAYLANGATFVDALSAAPVAGRDGAPVLLTKANTLPEEIAAELARLKPGKIVLLGAGASISAAVEWRLRSSGYAVERQFGADRFATAAAISRATFAPGVPVLYLANGYTSADALSAAPAGGMKGAPVLITHAGGVPASIMAEIKRLRPQRIVILGSGAAVGSTVTRTVQFL